ncbi:Bug family tripartite tricarboxylate transporter substrate binding protein [Pollutimonas harenae]|uniref:Tripartite tricarboxylate transporter substrate binding protein n=1 Tax=Pollutimonas harenae TaxID=657015 RepID=A0A853GXU2_9BURK|nr:tripartite tricarboxylate transporter substrate binding protein [Pollutimonas harenae]NYT86957.1 tripartite tricarboxylate transporter substrate binding protein [Pollutimonas harenae]TEA69334.1 tripartite tricarboxylate transporter substrate binding protein [Pollutimonas harenae]
MQRTFASHTLKTLSACALVALLAPGLTMAQTDAYPNQRLEVILPYAAGGGVDAMARAFSEEASKLTEQQWVVVNRPGAGGTVGFSALAHAQPTGYTIAFSPASALTNAPFLLSKMPFDTEQIEPVCQVFENVFAIAVTPDSPIKSLEDLIQKAKANPGDVSYGHAGPGSVPHLSVAAIEKALGITLNAIAYRGDGQMLPDLMGGHVDFGAPAISSLGGKNLRVLAVLADKRHPSLPDVPSMSDLGYPATTPGLNGLYVPAGTPEAIVTKLEGLCKTVVESKAFTEASANLQQVPAYLTAAQFQERLQQTFKENEALTRDLNIKKD